MADTLTPNIQITNQEGGGNNNTWGDIADANFERLDNVLGDITSIVTTGGTTALSDTQELVAGFIVTGALVSNATITMNGRNGFWFVSNATTGAFSVTFKQSAGTGVTVDQASKIWFYSDGSENYAVNEPGSKVEVALASASTTDVLGAATDHVAISGTTSITSFGTTANQRKHVRFSGALTVTQNATTLICPAGQSIRTQAGDTMTLISDASGNARVVDYQSVSHDAPGVIKQYAGAAAPGGWFIMDGAEVSETTYAGLFAIIGTTYNTGGEAGGNFRLPDATGRVIAGKEAAATRITTAEVGVNGGTLGATGGVQSSAIALSQLPNYSLPHTLTLPNHIHPGVTTNTLSFSALFEAGTNRIGPATASTGNTSNPSTLPTIPGAISSGGSNLTHTNLQPTIMLNHIIKY